MLVGGLEHFLFFHILGMSSSQLTNSYFFTGVGLNHQPVYINPMYRSRHKRASGYPGRNAEQVIELLGIKMFFVVFNIGLR